MTHEDIEFCIPNKINLLLFTAVYSKQLSDLDLSVFLIVVTGCCLSVCVRVPEFHSFLAG